ncbi:MAG: AAA family ATPase [Clostridiales bacterium]|nr:AAA family ATPase [Clostridiales bacterium]
MILLSENRFLTDLWNALSSWYAMIVYAAILVVLIIFLIITAMNFELRSTRKVIEKKIDTEHTTIETIQANAAEIEGGVGIIASGVSGVSGAKSEEGGDKVRFDKLCRLDERKDSFKRDDYDETVTLKAFCENFRAFCSNRLKLYYDIEDIRRFVAGMAVSNLLILQGMSGTGKTSLAYALGTYLENRAVVVPVQPMWKERTDLIGYYNEFTKTFNETTLLAAMYEANYSKDIYVTILDEMNIARVEYYFAEFLSLLELPEKEKRTLDVVATTWDNDPEQIKNGKIVLPTNMWFIGTANNDDSTFAISDKVYDRAMIMNLDNKAEPFVAPYTKNVHLSAERFMKLVKEAQEEYGITRRNINRLEALDKQLIASFHITFGNRIMKQIREYIPVYVACGGEELKALDDILSKKVIRKLETQSPTYIRAHKDEFFAVLDKLFGTDEMRACRSAIERIADNA